MSVLFSELISLDFAVKMSPQTYEIQTAAVTVTSKMLCNVGGVRNNSQNNMMMKRELSHHV
jgi:hypothetical protein